MNRTEEINKKILKASDDYMCKRVEDGCGYTGCVQPVFIEGAEWGYNQAQQDLELTLEDISIIREILCGMVGYPLMTDKEVCAEVLKRFKDFKERKNKT